MELNYDGFYTVGASHPGLPYFLLGKTPQLAWSVTAALTDLSDLYKEKISLD